MPMTKHLSCNRSKISLPDQRQRLPCALRHRSSHEAANAFHLKSREAALEAEVARAQRVADQMQQNLSKEAALVAQLRSQLSMAEALSEDPSAAAAISSVPDATRKDRKAELGWKW